MLQRWETLISYRKGQLNTRGQTQTSDHTTYLSYTQFLSKPQYHVTIYGNMVCMIGSHDSFPSAVAPFSHQLSSSASGFFAGRGQTLELLAEHFKDGGRRLCVQV